METVILCLIMLLPFVLGYFAVGILGHFIDERGKKKDRRPAAGKRSAGIGRCRHP